MKDSAKLKRGHTENFCSRTLKKKQVLQSIRSKEVKVPFQKILRLGNKKPSSQSSSLSLFPILPFLCTGCSLNIMYFPKIFLWSFSVFPQCQCVYTHQAGKTTRRYSRTGRVQKNHNILMKNTIFNEHPVSPNSHHVILYFRYYYLYVRSP